MIDEFELMPQEEPFDPFAVMLFKALQVMAFLFFIALLAIAPEAKDGKIDSKAEFLVTMSWPDQHPDDFDMFVQDPIGNMVWYRRREAGFMLLDRDDRGGANDFIMVNGRKVLSPIRQETVSIRGIVAGEYTVNVYHFIAMGREPVPVSVKVEKLNPIVQVVYYDTIMLQSAGHRTHRRSFRDRRQRHGDRRQQPREIAAADAARSTPQRGLTRMGLQSQIIGLSVAYVVLAALLLVVVLRVRAPWPLKVVAVVVTSVFYGVAFFRVEGLPGWSAAGPLPPQFQLLWARVVDPNPLDRDPGAVHVWVEELDAANIPSGQPRAFRLPYSPTLAAKVEAARDEILKGHPQGGRAADYGTGTRTGRARRSIRRHQASARGGAGRRSDRRRPARPVVPDRRIRQHRIFGAAAAGASAQGRAALTDKIQVSGGRANAGGV